MVQKHSYCLFITLQITQFAGPNKLFVFISAENLQEFRDAFNDLLEKHDSTNPPPTSTTTTKPAQGELPSYELLL